MTERLAIHLIWAMTCLFLGLRFIGVIRAKKVRVRSNEEVDVE